ncbi:MAG: biosynthetic-type acetolactate synthase large subunit [Candidatus Bathyarchaeia archaeon]
MSGANALIEALRREKTQVVFGLPGGAIMPVYDVFYKMRDLPPELRIRHVLARHEQSAAHMADGYARASGRVGVCMSTSGPGATNLVTGIATAFMDSSPLVAITGQVAKPFIGKDAFQETDIVGVVTSVTKYAFQARNASEVPQIVKSAFRIASTRRPGPVVIDIPRDVQQEMGVVDFTDRPVPKRHGPLPDPDPGTVVRMAGALTKAETPLIIAGGGVKIAEASRELVALAELLMCPVATSLMGKGCIPEDHPLSIGVMGMHGSSETNHVVSNADVLLIVGSRLSDRTTGNIDKFCPNSQILSIDTDKAEIEKNKTPTISLVSDAKNGLKAIYSDLAKRFAKKPGPHWFQKTRNDIDLSDLRKDGPYLSAVRAIRLLRKLLPRETIVTTEVGQNQMWSLVHFQAYGPRQFITSGGLGTMGFGFPAALGAKVACPDVPVLDIAGDGSFAMTENAMATSIEEQIPVTVVVLNNRMLGMVAQWHRRFYGRRYSGVELGRSPCFPKLAEAYGAAGVGVGDYKELSEAVKNALKSEIMTVIDVPVSPEEDAAPMLAPGAGLEEVTIA